jgi:glycosyltransferase involved in cell wall biosynthesis
MKISIVTVCFNSGRTIAKTFRSIDKQSYQNVEVIVVDGGSTDDTVDVVKSFGNLVDVFVSETDSGIYDALNRGLRLATGDVIGILHSNDFLASTTVLEEVAKSFTKMPDTAILLSSINFVTDNGDKIIREYTVRGFKPWMLSFGLMPPHPGSFFRSEVYTQVGLFNTSYRIAGDFDLFVRALAIKRLAYKVIPLVSVSMTTGGASTSGLKSYLGITKEFARSLSANGLFSSRLLVFLRVLFKLSQFKLLYIVRSKLL